MKLTTRNEKVLTEFANMMIQKMEEMKEKPWRKKWFNVTLGNTPMNISGSNYHGINNMMLAMHYEMNEYELPVYCTLKQANKVGVHINKGEKSIPIIFWDCNFYKDGKRITNVEYKDMLRNEQDDCTKFWFLKNYQVFNIEQTNYFEKFPEKRLTFKKLFYKQVSSDATGMYSNKAIDDMLKEQKWLCPIVYTTPHDKAFYDLKSDRIVIPMKKQFKISSTKDEIYQDGENFYATLIHEMMHSTGKEDRLNRTFGKKFGDKQYAVEEIIAELGSARVAQMLGFSKSLLDENATYLDSWIKCLKEQPNFILKILMDVEKASKMILDKIVTD